MKREPGSFVGHNYPIKQSFESSEDILMGDFKLE